jgi:hypothetical protein
LSEEIRVLTDEYKSAGTHSVEFNAKNLPSGIYVYTLITRQRVTSKKLILLKISGGSMKTLLSILLFTF